MEKELMTIIIGLGAPILVAIGGILSWFLKARKEELQAIEERALERRIDTYNQILHPIIVFFSNGADEVMKSNAGQQMGSVEYRKAAFNLVAFGSDDMVRAYNDMMQSFYKGEATTNPKISMKKFAKFILSIRKDVYSSSTRLEDWDMLKFMITDLDEWLKQSK